MKPSIRIKFIRTKSPHRRGDVVYMPHQTALELIRRGFAVKTVDMAWEDYATATDRPYVVKDVA